MKPNNLSKLILGGVLFISGIMLSGTIILILPGLVICVTGGWLIGSALREENARSERRRK